MKKILSMILALSMILTLLAGCGTAAAPASEPDPVDDAVEVTPISVPAAVEGVVKEASLSRIVVTLADGTSLAFDVTGIADLDVGLGDTVKVEYTGEIGSMVATSVTVTEKAEIVTATVTGVVTKIEDGFVFLTLEDGTEAALKSESVEEYDVEVGDTLTIEYVDNDTGDGVDVVSVEVVKAEKDAEEENPAVETVVLETTAPAPGTQAGNSNASGNAGASGGNAGNATGSSGASTAQVSAKKADITKSLVVTKVNQENIVYRYLDGSGTLTAGLGSGGLESYSKSVIGLNGRNLQVGDEVVMGWTVNGTGYFSKELSYIELTKAASGSYVDDDDWDDDDDDYYYDDDDDVEEDYTPSSNPSSGKSSSGSSQAADADDVYEVIRLINAERVKAGMSELEIDSELMAMAQVRAEELVTSYDHTRPDGRYYVTILDDFGWDSEKYNTAENLNRSTATAAATVSSWMNSSGHKANILREKVTRIGVGYCYGSGSERKNHWAMIVTS